MKVFVTGATGLVGREVCTALVGRGDEVVGLSRSASARLPAGVRAVQGDPAVPGAWQEELAACDACVHLAGEPVAGGRWTDARKRAIRDSRVLSTRAVAAVVARGGPAVLVSGSAVGYYGPHGDAILDEGAPPGNDFLASVCQEWEAAAEPARGRARLVLFRTGIVLSPRGGALERMTLPFKLFAGGPIGDGAFWQSWIHLADEVGLVLFALDERGAEGPMNATAPEPVRNRDFAKSLGRALSRPSLLPVPPFAIRAAFGEMAGIVITGQRVVPRKALELGYRFRHPAIDGALGDLLRRAA